MDIVYQLTVVYVILAGLETGVEQVSSSLLLYVYTCTLLIDINECSLFVCNQICVNTQGSYTCDCNIGYQFKNDNSTCEGKIIK